MGNSFLNMPYSIDFYFQIISLLVSLFTFIKKRNKIILYFIPFLLLTVIIELIGGWYFSRGIRNYALYNIFTTFEFIFYAILFSSQFKILFFKRFALFFIPLFLIIVLINIFFIQGFNKTFNTYTFLLGSFFIVIFSCFFFYESVLPDKIDHQLSKHPFFWICSGLLIFYFGSVIINALFEYLRNQDLQAEGIRIYGIINHTLNVILYSLFCVAFFLCRNHRKTYSSVL